MQEPKKEKKTLNRRQFIASSLGVAAASAVALGSQKLSGVQEALAAEEITAHENMPLKILKDYQRFDHKNTSFSRGSWDPKIQPFLKGFLETEEGRQISDEPGYTPLDFALKTAGWSVEDKATHGSKYGLVSIGLYNWDEPVAPQKHKFNRPEEASKAVKKAATFLGADLVGIADYDERWTYSKFFNPLTQESYNKEFPFKVKSVIAIAVEMDYEGIKTAPSMISDAAVGVGYSKMAEVSYKVATFLRTLGYNAAPAGNDTALSVPIAIQAGLGEVGRNGVLITPKYGPRVRLCKVFTDLPLAADKPITFGVQKFCETCKKCAVECPSESIPMDNKPSMNGPNISSNNGVEKWYVNGETCLEFWGKNGGCSNCIDSCPYNKLPVWNHQFALAMTKTPVRAILPPMDDLFGYGKTFNTKAMKKFWE